MTVPTVPAHHDPLDDTLLYDFGTPKDAQLNALFRLTAPANAQIEVIKVDDEMAAQIVSLFNIDSHDDTPTEILRFPGAPDAYVGDTRGMQSYNAWLMFGSPVKPKQIIFPRGINDSNWGRYCKILSHTLGLPVSIRK